MISRRKMAKYVAQAWVENEVSRTKLIAQMAAYLVESGRTHEVELLVNDILVEIEQNYGITIAKVISARPLSDALRSHIKRAVADKTGAERVDLSETIDEDLIGGAIINTPTMSIDYSVRGKLTNLRSHS